MRENKNSIKLFWHEILLALALILIIYYITAQDLHAEPKIQNAHSDGEEIPPYRLLKNIYISDVLVQEIAIKPQKPANLTNKTTINDSLAFSLDLLAINPYFQPQATQIIKTQIDNIQYNILQKRFYSYLEILGEGFINLNDIPKINAPYQAIIVNNNLTLQINDWQIIANITKFLYVKGWLISDANAIINGMDKILINAQNSLVADNLYISSQLTAPQLGVIQEFINIDARNDIYSVNNLANLVQLYDNSSHGLKTIINPNDPIIMQINGHDWADNILDFEQIAIGSILYFHDEIKINSQKIGENYQISNQNAQIISMIKISQGFLQIHGNNSLIINNEFSLINHDYPFESTAPPPKIQPNITHARNDNFDFGINHQPSQLTINFDGNQNRVFSNFQLGDSILLQFKPPADAVFTDNFGFVNFIHDNQIIATQYKIPDHANENFHHTPSNDNEIISLNHEPQLWFDGGTHHNINFQNFFNQGKLLQYIWVFDGDNDAVSVHLQNITTHDLNISSNLYLGMELNWQDAQNIIFTPLSDEAEFSINLQINDGFGAKNHEIHWHY